MDELSDNVAATLRAHGRATIGDVLRDHPATQGLASAVGLMVLATHHGHAIDGTEDIQWVSREGVARRATIRRRLFDPAADEFTARPAFEPTGSAT